MQIKTLNDDTLGTESDQSSWLDERINSTVTNNSNLGLCGNIRVNII